MGGLRQSLMATGCMALIVIAGGGVAGCQEGAIDQAVRESPTPTAPSAASATQGPVSSRPSPTVEGLEEHLEGLIASAQHAGTLSCDGSGPVTQGTALTCRWDPVGTDQPGGPVYVAVLDDTGRFAFSSRISGPVLPGVAVPSDFPAGTVSCATLAETPSKPARDGVDFGMDYATVVHYWMSLGSPASMDDDGDGLPCETVYPADVVARVASSPLVPGGTTDGGPVTRDQVRAHAEALLAGLHVPAPLLDDDEVSQRWAPIPVAQATTCGGDAVATEGSTLFCRDDRSDFGAQQSGGVLISVLDETGRYTYAHGLCCGAGPLISDFPAGSACEQLSQPPSGEWADGLDYRTLVFVWMLQGRPEGWDVEENGRPCEQYYTAEAVDALYSSMLRP